MKRSNSFNAFSITIEFNTPIESKVGMGLAKKYLEELGFSVLHYTLSGYNVISKIEVVSIGIKRKEIKETLHSKVYKEIYRLPTVSYVEFNEVLVCKNCRTVTKLSEVIKQCGNCGNKF